MSIAKPSGNLKYEKKQESYTEMFKTLLEEAKVAKNSLFDPSIDGPRIKNFEELENEFHLIQEKKSVLTASQRRRVVTTYIYIMAQAQKQEEKDAVK